MFNCLRFQSPPTRRAMSPYLHPFGNCAPLDPQALCSHFVASYGLEGGIRTFFHAGELIKSLKLKLKLKLIYDRQSVGQSVLMSGSHLRPMTRFFYLSDDCGFLYKGRPLWREDGSVIYCTIASGPCQSSHSWIQVPQNSWPYFTVSFETPPTWSWSWSSSCGRQSVDQFVWVSGLPLGPLTRF
jgi:hypothetical protein